MARFVKETALLDFGEGFNWSLEYQESDDVKRFRSGPRRKAIDLAIREYMDDVATVAVFYFKKHIPLNERNYVPGWSATPGRLRGSVERTRVNKTGNFWTVSAGLIPIKHLRTEGYKKTKGSGESRHYGLFVEHGTGRYGPTGEDISHGNVMAFRVPSVENQEDTFRRGFRKKKIIDQAGFHREQEIVTRSVKGQKAQHFALKTEKDTAAYSRGRKEKLEAKLYAIIKGDF